MFSITRTASIALALLIPGTAFASSDAAWAQFAKDVEQKCGDATASIFRKSQVVVDPTGSETFGLAIVFGRSKEAKGPAAVICVVDKKTGKLELGSELGKDVVRVRKPKTEGQDDEAGKKNNRKQQNQNDTGGQTNSGNSGGQDDMDDEQ